MAAQGYRRFRHRSRSDAELGAERVNLLSHDSDLNRTFDQCARFAELATARGLIATLEYLPGLAIGHLATAVAAVAKAGTDKMSFDMAVDLRPYNVASVSIWPGFILSDMLKAFPREQLPPSVAANLPNFETPEFTCLVIERLWRDPQRMALSGEAVIGAELGRRYGIKDLDGKQPITYAERMGKPSGRFIVPEA